MGNMEQMMKQLGMDVEEIDADKVEVHVGDKKLVFTSPQLSKIEAQGQEIFQLQGKYEETTAGPAEEDIELVMEKTGANKEEAVDALENSEDVAEAIMELQ